MSSNRAFAFFADSSNHILRFGTRRIGLSNFIHDVNKVCQLGLTKTHEVCDDPNILAWAGAGTDPADSTAWLREISVSACDELSSFAESTLDCITKTLNDYFEAHNKDPDTHHSSGNDAALKVYLIVGVCGLLLASLIAMFSAYKIYKQRQASASLELGDAEQSNRLYSPVP